MRKVELLPTRDCEAGYGPEKRNYYLGNSTRNFAALEAVNTRNQFDMYSFVSQS